MKFGAKEGSMHFSKVSTNMSLSSQEVYSVSIAPEGIDCHADSTSVSVHAYLLYVPTCS